MNILLSCSGGMSSSIIAQGLVDAAKKRGQTITVDPTGTDSVADDLDNKNYDIVLLAPQSVYRKAAIEAEAKEHDKQFLMIPRTMYNPIQASALLDLIEQSLHK
ncbi:hypothetical protein FC83_GL001499 [Agrilactobacillus composti DSM 18527 = JCM 14202]|jgi:PTS system cellobiose-specific IIB component|uniref:PTS EIIB type-3 domain-containing protein n=1 Tax=Agrilactobacillus composti DSM 18527 = JCM 14202 TaxID=1423734 RepID=X0PG83_9LACO|nr:PTS fructose transporter subunit IIA [Agrilactobacillus composti]KRM30938.1 hypothetical protein FC83_GL001499 [Agrilactobacillus composti DSM 18527 = JCM 14202]MCH4170355.1 PTS fructose transporter subunit IIA [Lactobacillus sp.]GAF40883.1 PTS system, diacetylchitobiose-specific IIB component [Agrilactobacillus composti DSM 18527 = JCM 14202]